MVGLCVSNSQDDYGVCLMRCPKTNVHRETGDDGALCRCYMGCAYEYGVAIGRKQGRKQGGNHGWDNGGSDGEMGGKHGFEMGPGDNSVCSVFGICFPGPR